VIRHRFEYRAPRAVEEAIEILAAAGDDCAVLGGGTWLIPNMTFAASQPKIVLDPTHLGLSSIIESDDEVLIGARVTYHAVLNSLIVRTHLPLLAKMSEQITGGMSIVGQGTIGGSACYANPSSDVPACLLALRARLQLRSIRGTREIDVAEFYRSPFATARQADEILTVIVFPKMSAAATCGYQKLKFSMGSWPIVTAAAVAEADTAGWLFRVAVGAASTTPVFTEQRLAADPRADELEVVSRSCAHIDTEWFDELAGPGYRRSVAPSVVLKALLQCGSAK
jgi:aerobic carbon-monoxide dehydrogenase medium subunit